MKSLAHHLSQRCSLARAGRFVGLVVLFLVAGTFASAQDWQDPWMECMPEPGAPTSMRAVPASLSVDSTVATTRDVVQDADASAPVDPESAVESERSRPFLGVYLEDADTASGSGVVIEECIADCAAEKAGLLTGDRLVNVAGQDVATAEDLLEILASCEVGERVVVVFERGGERWRTKARLTEAPVHVDLAVPATDLVAEETSSPATGTWNRSLAEATPPAATNRNTPPVAKEVDDAGVTAFVNESEFAEATPPEAAEAVPEVAVEATPSATEGASSAPGWLGIMVDEFTSGRLVVSEVVPGSPADRAGLRAKDQLTSVEGRKARGLDHLAELLGGFGVGSRVTIGYERADESHRTRVVLGREGQTVDPQTELQESESNEPAPEDPAPVTTAVRLVDTDADGFPDTREPTEEAANTRVLGFSTLLAKDSVEVSLSQPKDEGSKAADPWQERLAAQSDELDALRAENAELRAMVEDLSALVAALQTQLAEQKESRVVEIATSGAGGAGPTIQIHIDADNADIHVTGMSPKAE